MREKFKISGILMSAVGLLLILSLVWGIKCDMELEKAKRNINMDYQRCFTEVVQYVDDLQLGLEKSKFVNDPGQMMRLSGEIYRQASMASSNLAMLPLQAEPLEHLGEFLNQVGNYAYTLSFKMLNGNGISEEEYQNLASLEKYAKTVAQSLDEDLEALYNGELEIGQSAKGAAPSGIDKALGELETGLHDYPALIYDGPFSSHLTDRKPLFLEGMKEVSAEAALEKVKEITNHADFLYTEEQGNVPAYYFYDKNGQESIVITKQGGYLLSYLNDRDVAQSQYTMSDAKLAATMFLEKQGFKNMKESYYEIVSDVAVINYAAVQDGYTLYPDLIKVKVALDDCTVVGCETRGYLMHHTKRTIPEIKVSEEKAKSKVNSHVEVVSSSLTLIPSDGGTEHFCWQLEGKIEDRRCLIYVNTQTGAEEKLFILIESETGTLAV